MWLNSDNPFDLLNFTSCDRTMRRILKRLQSWLLGYVLAKVTAKECPEKLERLSADRQKEDCYFTYFDLDDGSQAIVFGYSDGFVRVKRFFENKYGDQEVWRQDEIPLDWHRGLRVIHYFHDVEICFHGVYDWLITALFPGRYVLIRIREIFGAFAQARFNKKKIVTDTRMEILGVVVRDYLDGHEQRYNAFDIATRLYSSQVHLRPDSDRQIGKLSRILESLRESGYLDANGFDYHPTGRGIDVFEQHEEEDRRHRQALYTQVTIALLTFFIAAPMVIHAGRKIISFFPDSFR